MDMIIASALLMGIALTIAWILKWVFTYDPKKIAAKHSCESASVLRKKYEEVDLRKYRGTFGRLALVLTLGLILVVFESYKSKEIEPPIIDDRIYREYDPLSRNVITPPKPEPIPEPAAVPPKPEPIVPIIKEVKVDPPIVKVPPKPIIKPIPGPSAPVVKSTPVTKPTRAKSPVPTPPVKEKDPLVLAPDVKAKYKGGMDNLRREIGRKYKIPREIKIDRGQRKKIVVGFVVERDGSIGEIKILKGIEDCENCSEEARRVLKGLKHKFEPGYQNEKPVRVWFTLPIVLQIN